MRLIEKVWFQDHRAKWLLVPLLLPLTCLFYVITRLRRLAYKCGVLSSKTPNIPVIIVGNIGVGGNGKTPLTLFLIDALTQSGLNVGVISRGYGAKAPYYPYQVSKESSAKEVGDEPLLIAQRSNAKVVIGAERIASCELLIAQGCEVIIADDGLQHYALGRSFEFVVIDGKRLFGNKLLLPAGPLREPVSRVNSVDAVVINGESDFYQRYPDTLPPTMRMDLIAKSVINVATGQSLTIEQFKSQYLVQNRVINAIAGIGDPSRFFDTLSAMGFTLNQAQGFIDHQSFSKSDLIRFSEQIPLLMTEKDAVKCRDFADENYWYLPVDASFDAKQDHDEMQNIIKRIVTLTSKGNT